MQKACLDGNLIEEIDVENVLRQGCCMAPVLFNLYTCTCIVIERWNSYWRGLRVLAST